MTFEERLLPMFPPGWEMSEIIAVENKIPQLFFLTFPILVETLAPDIPQILSDVILTNYTNHLYDQSRHNIFLR